MKSLKKNTVSCFRSELGDISTEYIFGTLTDARALKETVEALKKIPSVDMKDVNSVLEKPTTDFNKMMELMKKYS
ncbi:MAG: hypothetical protein HQK96_08030 [Nitrospirae bacterium]|nr:hypothetical protein [Nitrospirota bacterium]